MPSVCVGRQMDYPVDIPADLTGSTSKLSTWRWLLETRWVVALSTAAVSLAASPACRQRRDHQDGQAESSHQTRQRHELYAGACCHQGVRSSMDVVTLWRFLHELGPIDQIKGIPVGGTLELGGKLAALRSGPSARRGWRATACPSELTQRLPCRERASSRGHQKAAAYTCMARI